MSNGFPKAAQSLRNSQRKKRNDSSFRNIINQMQDIKVNLESTKFKNIF